MPVVIILIDAMRADRVRLDGDLATTPNLGSLVRDGVWFRSAFSSAPKTVPSVPQLLTSRHFPDIQQRVTFMSLCRDAGYARTGAFINNPYVKKWLARADPTFGHVRAEYRDATAITDDAIGWLKKDPDARFAMYVHYLDVHVPLHPPHDVAMRFVDPAYKGPIDLEFSDMQGAWTGRYDEADKLRIGQLYDATVAATDAQVGRLLAALREAGVYDRALIVVTSDHGEELWEHGGYFHGHTLYDELLHVPLIVKFPGSWRGGTTFDGIVGIVDVLPTITDLLWRASGNAAARPPTDGESLVAQLASPAQTRTLFATVGRVDDRSPPLYAVRTPAAKLVFDARDGSEMLFDLSRDRGEHRNIVAEPSARATLDTLRTELQGHLKTLEDAGTHARLFNGTNATLRYTIVVEVNPVAPFVNLLRRDMESGDRISQQPKAEGVRVEGVLEPGDEDEVRFDVLRGDGAIRAVVSIDPATAFEVCAGTAECRAGDEGRNELPLESLRVASRPSRRSSQALQLAVWYAPGETEPEEPYLSPADRERLRALGYAE